MAAAGITLYGIHYASKVCCGFTVGGPIDFDYLIYALAALTLCSVGFVLWRLTGKYPTWRIVLAVIGTLAAGLYFFAAVSSQEPGIILIGLLGPFVLGLCSIGIMKLRSRHDPSARGVGRMILGTAALIGAIALGGIAFFIIVFMVCVAISVSLK
jgi:hypothetical protein